MSKKEKEHIEQQAQLQIKKKAIQKAEIEKRKIAAAPASFGQDNLFKPKYVSNPFQYVGAQQDEDIEINLAPELQDSEQSDDGEDDGMDDYFKRNQKADEKKKINMT